MDRGTEAIFDSLTLILPAYDEVEGILANLRDAARAMRGLVREYEIIVVNDGSRDQTTDRVHRAMRNDSSIRLIEHATNLGYGAALRSGFRAATYPLVAFSDSDGQFKLDELRHFLPLMRDNDIVCGYRSQRHDPCHRRFLSWGYNQLIRSLFGISVKDCDCALKVFHRGAIERVMPSSNDFFVNTEILWRASRQGLRISEIAVSHRDRRFGQSTIGWLAVPRTLRTMLPFWWNHVVLHRRLLGAPTATGVRGEVAREL